MYNVKSLKAEEFISDEEIKATLAYADENKENLENDLLRITALFSDVQTMMQYLTMVFEILKIDKIEITSEKFAL